MAGKHVIELVPATWEHAYRVARRLRVSDQDEVMASGGYLPQTACARSVEASHEATAVLVDGEAVAIYGVAGAPATAGIGIVWLLAGQGFPECVGREFLRASRVQVAVWLTQYRLLTNWIDARNAESLRWLRWLGARFGRPEPRGPAGRQFVPFEFRRA